MYINQTNNPHIISVHENARAALQKLDDLADTESRTLFVVKEDGVVTGSITDGDIRRGLLAGKEISDNISAYMHRNFKSVTEDKMNPETVKALRNADITLIPVLDNQGKILRIVDLKNLKTVIPASALLMAGGRGERLRPLTDLVPKPMLKIGSKPIIEYNIDRLIHYGITEFFISVRYLSEQIIEYFGDGSSKNVSIRYIHEEEPLGTIAAFKLVDRFANEDVLVMNSDLLTNIDFEDFYGHFISSGAQMSVASFPYKIQVPYGVLELESESCVSSLKEKPTYTYYSNAGIYFLKTSVGKYIPENQHYNATDLMEDLLRNNEKLIHYPMLNYWLDIGRPEDFYKVQEDIKHIKF
jgi:dTDP-glucose pyrophosphorylase/CBS domain-containing protein